jgi:hypothetical protein
MSADDEEEDALLMRILGNEILWVSVAAVAILCLAFYLATK